MEEDWVDTTHKDEREQFDLISGKYRKRPRKKEQENDKQGTTRQISES